VPHDPDVDVEGWRENRKLVLGELVRVTRAIENLDVKISGEMTNIKVEVATIKTKVGVYAALIAIVVAAVISYLFKR